MEIDLLVEDSRWDAFGLPRLAQDALTNVFEHLSIDEDVVEVSILACDDARIAALNADFREKPTPTNVLSWPSDDLGASKAGALPQAPVADLDGQLALGDIAISYDTCFREAQDQDKQFEHHVAHLLVHGTLHLLGYDHLRDSDATLMERIESKILGKMGIDDPYRD